MLRLAAILANVSTFRSAATGVNCSFVHAGWVSVLLVFLATPFACMVCDLGPHWCLPLVQPPPPQHMYGRRSQQVQRSRPRRSKRDRHNRRVTLQAVRHFVLRQQVQLPRSSQDRLFPTVSFCCAARPFIMSIKPVCSWFQHPGIENVFLASTECDTLSRSPSSFDHACSKT